MMFAIGVALGLALVLTLVLRARTVEESPPSAGPPHYARSDVMRPIPGGHYMVTRTTILDPKSDPPQGAD